MVARMYKILTPCCGSIVYKENDEFFYYSVGERRCYTPSKCSFCNTELKVNEDGGIAGAVTLS